MKERRGSPGETRDSDCGGKDPNSKPHTQDWRSSPGVSVLTLFPLVSNLQSVVSISDLPP